MKEDIQHFEVTQARLNQIKPGDSIVLLFEKQYIVIGRGDRGRYSNTIETNYGFFGSELEQWNGHDKNYRIIFSKNCNFQSLYNKLL